MREDRAAVTGNEVELPPDTAIYEHPPTGFKVYGRPDFELTYHEDADMYELVSAARDLRVLITRFGGGEPLDVAVEWAQRLGLTVESQKRTADAATLRTTGAYTVETRRRPDGTVKLMAHHRPAGRARSQEEQAGDDEALALFASTAQFADAVADAVEPRPSEPAATEPIPLRFHVAEDVQSSGMVPDEPGWNVVAGRGFLGADNPQRGEFGRGFSFGPIAPTNPEGSLTAVWMPLRNQYGNAGYTSLEVLERKPDSFPLPGGEAGMFRVRATRNGVPWEGWIHVTTWRPPDGGTSLQSSWMLAPVDGDPRVWPALKKAWDEYVYNAEAAAKELQHVREISAIIRGETAPEEEKAK